jgi:hypothetical protein
MHGTNRLRRGNVDEAVVSSELNSLQLHGRYDGAALNYFDTNFLPSLSVFHQQQTQRFIHQTPSTSTQTQNFIKNLNSKWHPATLHPEPKVLYAFSIPRSSSSSSPLLSHPFSRLTSTQKPRDKGTPSAPSSNQANLPLTPEPIPQSQRKMIRPIHCKLCPVHFDPRPVHFKLRPIKFQLRSARLIDVKALIHAVGPLSPLPLPLSLPIPTCPLRCTFSIPHLSQSILPYRNCKEQIS